MKKQWKTKIERDIIMHEDIKESGLQGGKVVGDKIALFSLIFGIPLLIVGLYSLISMIFNLGFPVNSATIILALVVTSLGCLGIFSGYTLNK
jgi:hypothetical protein